MSTPDFMVGRYFTFTWEEEQEIQKLLRSAQRALWLRNEGYRAHVVGALTHVNRIIHSAVNRSHGVEVHPGPRPHVPDPFAD